MRKFLDFLIERRHWTLLLLLLSFSGVLMFYNTPYRRAVFVGSANTVVGRISSAVGSISSHMNLKETNQVLAVRNGILEKQVIDLQSQLNRQQVPHHVDSMEISPYRFVMAKVVRNSVSQANNYITIDKGTRDGITAGMGVISPEGVVGIVSNVSARFAVVLPILNPRHRLSCRLAGTSFFGSLVWDGRSIRHARLEELPRHMQVRKGDTVITSGFSAIFPSGIIVGTINDHHPHYDNNFYAAEVALSVNFSGLSDVHVIINSLNIEQSDIEQEAQLW
ncbi:MAG: rod shape-determining protein MreC [Tannerellaceae bacterium]|jgi:rod shape-determining protein MreC|nr:rod shape-determining protein MreC [Tannerellaceae bacterium]